MVWKSDEECVETESECALLKQISPTVYFQEQAALKIKFLCQKFEKLEWMAGLLGEEISPRNYCVSDIRLIDQEVTSNHVEATAKGRKQLAALKTCVGWIHSHNTMGSFQSGTDVGTAGNFPVTVTVNNDLEYTGMVKFKIECPHTENIEIVKKALVVAENQELKFPELGKQAEKLVKEKEYPISKDVDYTQQTLENDTKEGRYAAFNRLVCGVCSQKMSKRKRAKCIQCGLIAHERCLTRNGLCTDCLDNVKRWAEAEDYVGTG